MTDVESVWMQCDKHASSLADTSIRSIFLAPSKLLIG